MNLLLLVVPVFSLLVVVVVGFSQAIFPEENLETILSQCLDPPLKASVEAAIR